MNVARSNRVATIRVLHSVIAVRASRSKIASLRSRGGDERRPFKPAATIRAPLSANAARARSTEDRPFKSRDDRAPGTRPARRDDDRPYAKRDASQHASAQAAPPPVAESAPKHRDHHDGLVRLSKVMSELGLCSRREADEWIEKGWVLVDGEVIDTLGTRIRPTQNIEILPAAHSAQSQLVTILLHKPVGYRVGSGGGRL